MHELSLMEGVINTVRDSAVANGIVKVNKVKLVIGKLSMALPDSLQFAFQALNQQDKLFQDAVLEIEERAITCRCSGCDCEFAVENNYCFICPECAGIKVDIIQGRELFIDYFEGDDI